MTPLTLASASPRRRALLSQAHPQVYVSPSHIDERAREGEPPREFALRMAQEKALAAEESTGYVVAGDTVVALGEQILGKPRDAEEALEMLGQLSGRTHHVWSGWAVRGVGPRASEVIASGVSCGEVTFRSLSAEEVRAYVSTGEPLDKAGSYGIQGLGGKLVSSLKGSFDGVMGLPTLEVVEALLDVGALTPAHPQLLRSSLALRERVRVAAWRSGRPADAPRLLAVSKRHPVELIQEALGYDLTHFGENYLQELTQKRAMFDQMRGDALPESPAPLTPTWHYIGALQTNKAKRIGSLASWVHGASRLEELRKLSEGACAAAEARALPLHAQPLRVLIQVNLSGEQSKGGVSAEALPQLLEASSSLLGLKVEGLMTFPPPGEPEESRPFFKALRELRDSLATPERPLEHLSMGTSQDFEVAVEEGATWTRVGTALFGERPC